MNLKVTPHGRRGGRSEGRSKMVVDEVVCKRWMCDERRVSESRVKEQMKTLNWRLMLVHYLVWMSSIKDRFGSIASLIRQIVIRRFIEEEGQ